MGDSDEHKHVLGSLADCIRKMYETREHGDITIRVGKREKKFKAHSFILRCRSKVLSAIVDEEDYITPFRNIREDTFKQFLEFMYTDYTDITIDNVVRLLRCANKFKTYFLAEFCKNYLRNIITSKNLFRVLKIAKKSKETEIIEICSEKFKYLRQNSLLLLLETDEFLKCHPKFVLEIVKDSQSFAPEEIIFDKVLLWLEAERKRIHDMSVKDKRRQRRSYIEDIIEEIRFPIMEDQYLHDVVCRSKLLSDIEKVDILRHKLKTSSKCNGSPPCIFHCKPRKWHTSEQMIFKFLDNCAHHDSSKSFSVKFRANSLSFLVGIHLNISEYPNHYTNSELRVIIKLSSQDNIKGQEFLRPISECVPDKFLKLCPPFTIPLNPNVEYTISLLFEATSDFKGKKVDHILDMNDSGRRLQIIDAGLKSEIPFISSLRIA